MNAPTHDRAAGRPTTLLLTGAAGALGRVLTLPLRAACERLIVSDLPGPLSRLSVPDGIVSIPCDLADAAAVRSLLRGVDAVVHLGGVSVEGPFAPILQSNILGLHNLYEAARLEGVRRIVFASSNHVTGCYRRDDHIGSADRPRPDGNYGLSKLFGEGIASLYWDRYGIETVCLRIGTATPTPPDRRALASWLSLPDLARLVMAALTAPEVGFLIAFGCSDNTRRWWDTTEGWARLGFEPRDKAEIYAAEVEHLDLPPGPQRELQGGSFLGIGPFDESSR